MDDQNNRPNVGQNSDREVMTDVTDEHPHIGFEPDPDSFEERVHLEMHRRGVRHERGQHIDLSKEEYTPDEVARLIGTSRDVVIHAARTGELKSERAGHDIVCIKHEDVVVWLRKRAGV